MRLGSGRTHSDARRLGRAARRSWGILLAAGICSGGVNVLALTGPLYMLEVYNDVLPSGRTAQLGALTIAMLGLYAVSGLLDFARLRLMWRAALRVDRHLSRTAFAIQQQMALKSRRGDGLQPLRDLDQIRAFVSSAGPTAVFDLPWMPLYLIVIYAMHPLLGALATAGAVLLIALMLLGQVAGRAGAVAAAQSAAMRWSFAADAYRNAEAAQAMALNANLHKRWSALNEVHGGAECEAARRTTAVSAAIKVARPALRSATLGLGAYLFVLGEASAGAMVAASIILSRALAPLETAIAHWRGFTTAHQSYRRLTRPRAAISPSRDGCPHGPRPARRIEVASLTVTPPGAQRPVLHDVSFALTAGDGLGIVGPSGSGKSTLARAMVGVWSARQGRILFDGEPMTFRANEIRGRHIGYVPQDVALLSGSIADNIARFDADADEAAIVAAAQAAGVHDMILRLKHGYATHIGDGGAALSAGQRQRIALARALYGEPFLVVLDEPNSNLDSEGDACLTAAIAKIRKRGGIAIVIAHRRSALAAVDKALALAHGRIAAFGPKQRVLERVLSPRPAARPHIEAAE